MTENKYHTVDPKAVHPNTFGLVIMHDILTALNTKPL